MNDKTSDLLKKASSSYISRLASFPEVNPWPILEINDEGQLTYINPATTKAFPDIASKEDHSFLKGIKLLFEKLGKKKISGVEREVEVNEKWFLQNITLIPPNHLRIYATDITERKRTESGLKSSELRYRRLFESALDGILLVDYQTGMIVDVNPFLIKLLDYTKAEFLNKHLWDIGAFKDVAESKEKFSELQAKKYIHYENLPLETKSGGKVDVEVISYAYKIDEETKIQLIQCNVRDITERKKIESKLSLSESSYKRLFEAAQDGILIIDSETGVILDANKFLLELLGYAKEELIKKHFWNIAVFKDIAASKESFLELQSKGYVRYEDLPLETKEGKSINVEFVSNVYDVDGRKSIQCNIRDITDRKKKEAALRQSTDELKRFNKVMIGREIKMIDLKKEIKELKEK